MTSAPTMSAGEFAQLWDRVLAWGRWGAEDEQGALNLVTPQVVVEAAALVRTGRRVSLAAPIAQRGAAADDPTVVTHVVKQPTWREPDSGPISDYFAMAPHGNCMTHVDALNHYAHGGRIYNGYPAGATDENGVLRCGVSGLTYGAFTSAVLLDLPAAAELDWLEPGMAATAEDLRRCADRFGITARSGDAVFVRTGRTVRQAALGDWPAREALAGLHPSAVEWLSEHGVSMVGCDGVGDTAPSPVEGEAMPIHALFLVAMGVHMIDNCRLEDLTGTCRELDRWRFAITVTVPDLAGATGMPVNPIALF